ncbi:MAG: hypothetical protein F9K27_05150 [Anaerolineae bacterium]|nr:MAG: hypothetical protein F9K27_05150 [Anaerolineae bacterium]
MKYKPRLFWALLVILILILAACGGDEGDEDNAPTPPSQLTRTITPVVGGGNTPTPLPTVQGFVSATPLQLSTSAAQPTQIGAQPTPLATSSFPNAIGLTSPASGTTVRGNIAIFGSASHPQFVQYALEYGPDPNPSGLWYPITTVPITSIVLNNALGVWNTTTVRDGNYQIRLHVWLSDGRQDFRTVTNIQVRNAAPTQPAPNNPPLLAPITNVKLIKGTSVTIALGMSDIDNDPLTYVAQVSNPALVTVTPSGSSAITVNGVNAGSATIFVTVSDGRGGSASQAFTVTVDNPPTTNNPPSITPISSQTLNTGTSVTINVVATDPDPGDTVSLKVASADTSIVNASISGTAMVLTGAKEGTASVTVTATDSKGLSSAFSFSATVTNPAANNRPPTFNPVSGQTLDKGALLDVDFVVTDPDSDPLTLSATSSNNGVVTGLIVDNNTIRLNGVSAGSATVTIAASDGRGGTANTSFSVTVNPVQTPNTPPVVNDLQGQTINVGDQIEVTVTVSDADGDSVTIAASASPDGIVTVTSDGVSKLTIQGAAQGTAQVTVTASDGKDNTTKSFNVTVNQTVTNNPPTITPIGDQTLTIGQTLDVSVITSDPDGDTVSISASSANSSTASVSDNGSNTVTLTGNASGTTQVTVTADDGTDTTQITFNVTVSPPANNPPSITSISDQTLDIGQTLDVAVTTSDPDGDTVTISAAAVDGSIVSVSDNGSNNVSLTGSAQGTTQVTVTASDGTDTAQISFNVTVTQPFVNTPPTINPVGDQVLNVGQTIDVGISTGDADGDTVSISASVVDGGIASVSDNGSNNVSITGNNAGSTLVTVTATDGTDTSQVSFNVTVNAVNAAPSINPVGGQVCDANTTIPVGISYSDPDGDTVNVSPSSDNAGVAEVNLLNASTLNVNCYTAGTANITVNVDDGKGGANSTGFTVTVNAVNAAPNIDPIGGQVCDEGTSITVGISYSDPDGDPVSVNPSSDNSGVASVSLFDANTLAVDCLAAGNANISVGVDDGKGGTNLASFGVTVNAVQQPPQFDVTVYPEIPTINPNDLIGVYQDGINNQGKRNNVFAVVGDDPMNSSNFLEPLGTGTYTLGNYSGLEAIINFYNVQPAHDLQGDPATSFNVQSAATGDGWTIEDLFNSNRSPGYCNGAAPLDCELQNARPSVLIVSFSANNAAATPVDVFRSNLQNVVNTAYSAGTIPVLATIPDDSSIDPALLAQYNEAIVEVATNSNAPLWNVYNALQNTNVYGVGGSGSTDFSDGALTAGYNRRNLSTLQMLEAVKAALFP